MHPHPSPPCSRTPHLHAPTPLTFMLPHPSPPCSRTPHLHAPTSLTFVLPHPSPSCTRTPHLLLCLTPSYSTRTGPPQPATTLPFLPARSCLGAAPASVGCSQQEAGRGRQQGGLWQGRVDLDPQAGLDPGSDPDPDACPCSRIVRRLGFRDVQLVTLPLKVGGVRVSRLVVWWSSWLVVGCLIGWWLPD